MVSAVTGGGRVVVEADLGQGQQGGAGLDGIGLTAQRGGAVDAATRGGADDLVTAGVDDAHLPAVHPEALQDRGGVGDQAVLDVGGLFAAGGVQHDHGALPGRGLLLTGHQLPGAGAGAPVDPADVVAACVGAGDRADLADAVAGGGHVPVGGDAGGCGGLRGQLPDHGQPGDAGVVGQGAAQVEQTEHVAEDHGVAAQLVAAAGGDAQPMRHGAGQGQVTRAAERSGQMLAHDAAPQRQPGGHSTGSQVELDAGGGADGDGVIEHLTPGAQADHGGQGTDQAQQQRHQQCGGEIAGGHDAGQIGQDPGQGGQHGDEDAPHGGPQHSSRTRSHVTVVVRSTWSSSSPALAPRDRACGLRCRRWRHTGMSTARTSSGST